MSSKQNNWQIKGGMYIRATDPKFTDGIPPGFYDLQQSREGLFFVPKKLVTDDLQVLPGSSTEQVMQELADFWSKRALYDRYKLVYKRGILLHGEPGMGKTSTVNLVIRAAVERGAICFKEQYPALLLTGIANVRSVHPDVPILCVIEDIDELAHDPEFLDLLDGASQVSNVTYLTTTNYLAKLPARLKNRPSRLDTLIEVVPPNEFERAAYLQALTGKKANPAYVEATKGLSYAHIKEFFISTIILGRDANLTLARLGGLPNSKLTKNEQYYETLNVTPVTYGRP